MVAAVAAVISGTVSGLPHGQDMKPYLTIQLEAACREYA